MNGRWLTKLGMLVVMGLVAVLAGCGGGGGGNASPCTSNGNIELQDAFGDSLASLAFTAVQNGAYPADQSVFVAYNPDPAVGVAVVLAGYPPSEPNPELSGVGIDSDMLFVDPAVNPLEFHIQIINNTLPVRTYNVVWRFVIADINGNPLGCQDLPVAYTITAP